MTRKFIFLNLLLAVSLLPMLSCSSLPSSSMAEQVLREKIKNESKGRIKLISFSKTNGQEVTPMGIQRYILDYEAEIEFLDDCRWGTKSLTDNSWRGDFTVFSPEEGSWPYPPSQTATKGSRTKVSSSLLFEKTEAGWRWVKPTL